MLAAYNYFERIFYYVHLSPRLQRYYLEKLRKICASCLFKRLHCEENRILNIDNQFRKVLTCGVGGEWSGKAPQCRFVDCGAPAQIEFGSVTLINGSTTVKSLAAYTCLEDYWLVGEAKQECTKEGKWSHDTPSCECKQIKSFLKTHTTLNDIKRQITRESRLFRLIQ